MKTSEIERLKSSLAVLDELLPSQKALIEKTFESMLDPSKNDTEVAEQLTRRFPSPPLFDSISLVKSSQLAETYNQLIETLEESGMLAVEESDGEKVEQPLSEPPVAEQDK